MNETTLYTFPANRSQAIALAWLNQQDLSHVEPAEAAKLFDTAYHEIKTSLSTGKTQHING